MINIVAWMSLIIFAYWVLTIIIALYKTAIEYNKWNYVYWDKKHSNEHIALLFWLLMVAILFISWTFFHIDMSHAWWVHMVSENLSFLFIFKWVLYYYLSNHLSKELNNIT